MPLHRTETILEADFDAALKMKVENARKLDLGPIQTKRYIEAYSVLKQKTSFTTRLKALNIIGVYNAKN